MKRYKVVGSSKSEFMDIDVNVVFDDTSMGKQCEVFGHMFTITQTGMIMILSHPDWVLTLQELDPEPVEEYRGMITNYEHLRINHEIDLYFGQKEIKITRTDRLDDEGVTFKCLHEFLQSEWRFLSSMVKGPFPFAYKDEWKLFILDDSWNIVGDVDLLREGSFSRYNAEGRCI